jgi:hypothetical protein
MNSRTLRLAVLGSLVFSICVFATAEKQRDWKTGRVLDSERSHYFAGTVGGANTSGTVNDNGNYNGTTNSSQTAIYRVYETFVIEGDTYVYQAQEHIKWRWSKPANLTVNGPVKYAVEKRKLYVIDEDGKEHEMEIVKKTLKTPEPASK